MRMVILLILPFAIGAIVGFFSHDLIGGKVTNVLTQSETSPAEYSRSFNFSNNLRIDLNSVYRENVILLTSALRRIYDREPYAPDALEALNENTQDVGDIIGKYYGTSARDDLLLLWKKQNQAYIDYTEASRDKDPSKKASAINTLDGYINSSLEFWSKLNPTFDTKIYQGMLKDRANYIKNFINDLSLSQIAESYKEQHIVYQQNGKVADFLTISIVKQFPEKFKSN